MMNYPNQDPAYSDFIRTVVATGTVYTLQDGEDYFAECPSEVYENRFGEPETVYCFWHNAAAANECRQEEWADYRTVSIGLIDFMYDILIDMDQDQVLAGIAFDPQLYGTEIEPVELLGDLLDEMAFSGRDNFPEFDELQSYRLEWERIMAHQEKLH
ncbi:DUF2750 domain-containing protein [Conchiformibius steedae DSM 2580]|uniref:DUF2750 domain-containing protein n=2 Tax=Conchiformibius steedae TaxID=153493 RepID=A0A3P2A1H8_9NEIS|nr:DUF2750 domain-containing protein [Conchiformibius steedae]QMT34385.1 DUF2750 domain-containing protein [Conchiformibius steedae]RRD88736.1 DUF2750 domain-containing protein [Conchiformibius steedae]URD67163.1 DUF2750 domain-containing protein [Conchiformibius steedae DSM 2580]